ncbi:glycoside hydrolase family 2 TIM barrel-domain containing protein [Mucilaginibacter sp. Mucisp86]|uniref:glycoside hydrolase family 2 TIM barrel-domain containing protein n=1 Tax=Mucilaginibacter sp. Mucisp86 TaxID=3243060 RepID=UPI0039B6AF47
MNPKKFSLIILSFLFAHTVFAQRSLFNSGWQCKYVEYAANKSSDTSHKLGNNWKDQFLIEKINIVDSSFNKHVDVEKELQQLSNKKWQKVTLPHIAFPEPLVITKPREGIAYYKKDFFVSEKLRGKRLSIEFEGAMQIADVWMNGKLVSQHQGGYLPFTIDITEIARYGGSNTIVLKLQNKSNPVVPPGKPVNKLDFIYYSGLYRNVWLRVSNPLHITNANAVDKQAGGGIFVTYPSVSKERATVDVQTHVRNEGNAVANFNVEQNLIDPTDHIVASIKSDSKRLTAGADKHYRQSITVNRPLLWHPDHPYLYRLQTIIRKRNKIYDEKTTRLGIRSFELSKDNGLLINGEPFIITGTNRHQNYPYIGNALSDNANYRDAYLIKSAGMNCVRTAHYPQATAFLDAADELGILIVDCIPGWQFFNKDPAFAKNVFSDIRQTIRRDRNHPSILLWETSLNETYPPAEFRCKQNEVAKSEWIGMKNFFTSGDSYYTKACWDVPYDDWSDDWGPEKRNNTTYPEHNFLIREYGDYEFGGGNSTSRQLRGAGQNALLQQAWNLQWEHNKNLSALPRCIGDLTWAFYDGLAGVTDEIEAWGVSDLLRIPKFSFYFFQSQQPASVNKNLPTGSGPMVFIANYWKEKTDGDKVVVYSNCDEVALYANDKLIAKQAPDSGPETNYGSDLQAGGKPFDGGNCNHLKHPPFTFHHIPFMPGTLKAVGLIDGKAVTSYRISTPGEAAAIQLEINDCGKHFTADGADVVFVHAKVVDKEGNLCIDKSMPLTIKVSGDATLVSPETVNAEAGIATFLLRAGTHPGNVQLISGASGLKEGHLTVHAY